MSRFISSRFISITRYPGSQHTDFQPSNIYYVEPGSGGAAQKNARLFTFIDIGGMGAPVMESDKDHFIKSAALTDSVMIQSFYSQRMAGWISDSHSVLVKSED